jgi:hypothetical protein
LAGIGRVVVAAVVSYLGNRQQTFQTKVDVAFEVPARVAGETATRTSPHHVKPSFLVMPLGCIFSTLPIIV